MYKTRTDPHNNSEEETTVNNMSAARRDNKNDDGGQHKMSNENLIYISISNLQVVFAHLPSVGYCVCVYFKCKIIYKVFVWAKKIGNANKQYFSGGATYSMTSNKLSVSKSCCRKSKK